MPDLSIPNTFVAGATATAASVNQNFDEIETAFNGSVASVLGDTSTAGRIIVCNGSGVPQYVAASGDATVSSSGAFTLAGTAAEQLGYGSTRRGKSIIATEESRTNTAFGTLTTPDQVANVVLPTNGLIVVAYQALWKSSVAGAGRAALFIGANQLVGRGGADAAAPFVQTASLDTNDANEFVALPGRIREQPTPLRWPATRGPEWSPTKS